MIKVTFNNTRSEESTLEQFFAPFRKNVIGSEQFFLSPYGQQKIIYADWTASGRLYKPIEAKLVNDFGPFIANTHTETNFTGTTMTLAYKEAKRIIKQHVNADESDVIIFSGFGMTSAISRLQRMLNLKLPETYLNRVKIKNDQRPVIFVTHMEHHSNQTSWLETIGEVVLLPPDKAGLVDLNQLDTLLKKYHRRKLKIGSFTACSNVTGITTPYYQLARKMHEYGGLCFVDFSASAPYVKIDMHPHNSPLEKLDGIFFSPHKFLGGPGTSGVLVFDSRLYSNSIPDKPGGGTVYWTNPWNDYGYFSNIEDREDGGTPGILQAIKTALTIRLKEEMGIENLLKREEELKDLLFAELEKIPKLIIYADEHKDRLGIISLNIEGTHYNLVAKLLNDRFGIQVRGGCSCAGTYGHYLLDIDRKTSKNIMKQITQGDLSQKPGWVRASLHPTMTNAEVRHLAAAIQEITKHHHSWQKDYYYDKSKNEFFHKTFNYSMTGNLFE